MDSSIISLSLALYLINPNHGIVLNCGFVSSCSCGFSCCVALCSSLQIAVLRDDLLHLPFWLFCGFPAVNQALKEMVTPRAYPDVPWGWSQVSPQDWHEGFDTAQTCPVGYSQSYRELQIHLNFLQGSLQRLYIKRWQPQKCQGNMMWFMLLQVLWGKLTWLQNGVFLTFPSVLENFHKSCNFDFTSSLKRPYLTGRY